MFRRRSLFFLSVLIFVSSLNMAAIAAEASLSARNLPADDKILFFMGQDSDSLTEYKNTVLDSDITMPRPGGFTIYTPLKIFPEDAFPPGVAEAPIDSLLSSGNWGDREHNLQRSLAEYPNSAIAIGLDMKDPVDLCGSRQPLRAIAATGDEDVIELTPQYHAVIDQMIVVLKETKRPVYLRIGYEFDGPWNCYDQDLYKQVFRFIKQRIDALGARNIATVWQTASAFFDDQAGRLEYSPSNPTHLDDWYPGDEYVDWIGLSTFVGENFLVYQAPGAEPFISVTPREVQNRLLDFSREHNKPVMIAEAAPQAFDITNLTASPFFWRLEQAVTAEEIWGNWYADWFDFIESNSDIVRAVAYINADWTGTPLWRCDAGAQQFPGHNVPVDPNNPDAPACPDGTYWGDTRVQGNAEIFARFKAELQKEIYVNGGVGVEIPGQINETTEHLAAGDRLSYKLLVPEDGRLIVKLKAENTSGAVLLARLNGKYRFVWLRENRPARLYFGKVPRDQLKLDLKVLYGAADIKKISAHLR